MKFAAKFSLLTDLRLAIQHAFLPTLRDIARSPSILLHPTALSRLFMSHVWIPFGNGVDEGGRPVKQGLITPHAYGVVLDIGAGHGHTVNYLDRNKVSKYIALEPNVRMHPQIITLARAAGFTEDDGTLLIISCGAEDMPAIISSLSHGQDNTRAVPNVDTLISILTLCSIPSPERTLSALVNEVLKPGGQFLFYEHVLSPKKDVAWWQRFWTPIWKIAFDGCRLDRPTHLWVERMGVTGNGSVVSGEEVWRERSLWGKEGEDEDSLFWHRVGRFIKA